MERDLLSVHPYVGLELGDDFRMWAAGTIGGGDIRIGTDDPSESAETEAKTTAIGVGVEREWGRRGVTFVGRLEALAGSSELSASQSVEDLGVVNEDGSPVKNDITRFRAEVEAGRDFRLESGETVRGFLLASGRKDGGDLDGSGAFEVGGGLSTSLASGYEIDLRMRLQVNDTDHREHSVSGRVVYDLHGVDRGLLASLSHDGEAAAEVGYGWGTTLFGHRGTLGPSLRYATGSEALVSELGFVSDGLRLKLAQEDDGLGVRLELVGFRGR